MHLLVLLTNPEWNIVRIETERSFTLVQYKERPPRSSDESAKWKDAEKKERETELRSVMRAAAGGQGRHFSDPPWPSPNFSLEPGRSASHFFLETSEAHASLSPATMNQSSSSSHARWLGQSWNVAWKGWDSSATTSPISESIPVKTTPQKTRFRSVRIYKICKEFTYK